MSVCIALNTPLLLLESPHEDLGIMNHHLGKNFSLCLF
jgi:hypothetical protein